MIAKDPIKIAQWRSEVFNYTKHTIEYLARKIAKKFSRENDLVLNLTDSDVNIPESNLNKITEEIVDNAFKFSKAGTKVVVEAGNKNNDTLQFNVSNEGPGMTPEQINGIGAFQQFDRKMNEQQGSGLGLIIAKRMVELQGGKFIIISEPDKKTTVQITLSTHA